jgi:lipopolysaccharide/colanic/teichoic acid biosynthesis glycosyltransferase
MALHHDKSIGGKATIGPGAPARSLDQLFTGIPEVIAATTILLCLAPVLLISSVAIRLGSRGPVFLRETRRDSRNRPVQVFRFRLATADAQLGSSHRLTRLGLILTETGINELPQFFNVLLGEVSFIEAFKSLL